MDTPTETPQATAGSAAADGADALAS
ncbi:hypothetical protein SAMN05216282_108143, partial [Cryobacterium psychrotolerans]